MWRNRPRLRRAAGVVILRRFPVPGAGLPHQDIRQLPTTRPHNPPEQNSDANKCAGQEMETADTSPAGRVPCWTPPIDDQPENPESAGLTPLRFRLHFGSRSGEQPGVVAQLVRAPDCRSGGCGFESRPPRFRASFANPANEAFLLGLTSTRGRTPAVPRRCESCHRFKPSSSILPPRDFDFICY